MYYLYEIWTFSSLDSNRVDEAVPAPEQRSLEPLFSISPKKDCHIGMEMWEKCKGNQNKSIQEYCGYSGNVTKSTRHDSRIGGNQGDSWEKKQSLYQLNDQFSSMFSSSRDLRKYWYFVYDSLDHQSLFCFWIPFDWNIRLKPKI